jgi:hypothetical protein
LLCLIENFLPFQVDLDPLTLLFQGAALSFASRGWAKVRDNFFRSIWRDANAGRSLRVQASQPIQKNRMPNHTKVSSFHTLLFRPRTNKPMCLPSSPKKAGNLDGDDTMSALSAMGNI